jgi:sterol desaturase/sphingolipid hydroxylase (fatty acid hydroxylase superfamily)
LLLAIAGRSFNQSIALPPGLPRADIFTTQTTTPGLGVGIFWAVCGVLALLFGSYLAFRLIRFAKRLANPNQAIRPRRTKVMQVLKLSVITGLIGILLMILGTGATIGVLLSKSVALPQGVAIYDPNRSIRSVDVFVAAANTTGITAHFVGVVASLSVFNWLHRPTD